MPEASYSPPHLSQDCMANLNDIPQVINETCFCVPLDRARLDKSILTNITNQASFAALLKERPNLFAITPVFIAKSDLQIMRGVISAIEAIIDRPAYRQHVFARTKQQAHPLQATTHGLFMGYDFHLGPAGPQLIEINTNAGGAFLMAKLLQATTTEKLCCHGQALINGEKTEDFIFEMIKREWQTAQRNGAPRTLAIVDDRPELQYLYPDMLLAQELLNKNGIATVIVDTSALAYKNNTLVYGDLVIDMVYNRVTDFALSDPAHLALQMAYHNNAVVLSPAPDHHVLFADKRNLAILSDFELLQSWDIETSLRPVLAHIPKTQLVTNDNAEMLWARRNHYFFKPVTGYGGKAAYRGEKLTRKVWSDILNGLYVAQDYIEPSERMMEIDHTRTPRKFDIRLYTYAGEPFLIAARIYQGQTTNFRTPGGGFAPVIVV